MNSTIVVLTTIDKIAFKLPRILYNGLESKQVSLLAFLLTTILAIVLVYSGSYRTHTKPANALEPNDDKDSKYYDVTDNDGSVYNITHMSQLIDKVEEMSLTQICLLPFFAGGAMYGLWWGLSNIKENLVYYSNWYFLVMGGIMVADMVVLILGGIGRGVKTWDSLGEEGLKNDRAKLVTVKETISEHVIENGDEISLLHEEIRENINTPAPSPRDSRLLFPRYRLSISASDYPLGPLQSISHTELADKMAGSHNKQSWINGHKSYIESNNLKIWEPTTVKSGTSLVFDTRFVWGTIGGILVGYLFYQHNPILNLSYEFLQTNWLVGDIIGIAAVHFSSLQMSVSRFKYAFILLTLFFLYDMYLVFGTTVMLDVATGLDIPLKLQLPLYVADSESLNEYKMMMLGLGDIILPSMLIALCLRFDLYRHHEKQPQSFHYLQPISRPYFITGLVAYGLGLILTITALFVFNYGQPALFYIVPLLLLSVYGCAWIRGELTEFWAFRDTVPEYCHKVEELLGEEDEEDEDFEGSDNESFDEWLDRIEDDQTDLDDQDPQIIYVLESEDDDTFIIGSGSDYASEDSDADSDSGDDDILNVMRRDLMKPVRECLSDDE